MKRLFTENDLDEIIIEAAADGRHRDAAVRLEELAAQPDLHSEVSAATLLVSAGGQYGLANDFDEAIRCYRAAFEDGGETEVDPRVWLHDALMRKGDMAEAKNLRAELKKSRSTDPEVYGAVADSLVSFGQDQEAHTWYTMGYHRCQEAPIPEFMLDLLLIGRRNARRRMGYPVDELDMAAEEYMDSFRHLGEEDEELDQ